MAELWGYMYLTSYRCELQLVSKNSKLTSTRVGFEFLPVGNWGLGPWGSAVSWADIEEVTGSKLPLAWATASWE
ncbi:hypothetical protein C4D60_Mb08t03980 [Musa balbisiana]|uniref:Uncharacterized protein n=1 Tax=Musa balbisiana TaxID=52838 RepID=A0A4S8K155_MUSBA|nr:hypothetical protein C4D60_Mb08t03980 [Musa balbisiana]